MTVIAWDGRTLAADKQATNSGLKLRTTKIHRVGDAFVAFSGGLDQGTQMLEWIREGCNPATFPAAQREKDDWTPVAVFRYRQPIQLFERQPTPVLFEVDRYAMGSGRDYAMAVLHMGFDAIKAVHVACELDAFCGVGFDVLRFE